MANPEAPETTLELIRESETKSRGVYFPEKVED